MPIEPRPHRGFPQIEAARSARRVGAISSRNNPRRVSPRLFPMPNANRGRSVVVPDPRAASTSKRYTVSVAAPIDTALRYGRYRVEQVIRASETEAAEGWSSAGSRRLHTIVRSRLGPFGRGIRRRPARRRPLWRRSRRILRRRIDVPSVPRCLESGARGARRDASRGRWPVTRRAMAHASLGHSGCPRDRPARIP